MYSSGINLSINAGGSYKFLLFIYFSCIAAFLMDIIVLSIMYLNIGTGNKTKMCWKGNFEVLRKWQI